MHFHQVGIANRRPVRRRKREGNCQRLTDADIAERFYSQLQAFGRSRFMRMTVIIVMGVAVIIPVGLGACRLMRMRVPMIMIAVGAVRVLGEGRRGGGQKEGRC
jgi:hypothetical protein